MIVRPESLRRLVATLLSLGGAVATSPTAAANEAETFTPRLHGPSAPDGSFPSHRFQLAAHTPERVQLGFHYGLGQPITAGGFNAAVDVRYKRFVFTYSHGQGLNVSSIALSSDDRARGATLWEPWTTGFGVGAVLLDELHLLVDFKVHRFELSTGAESLKYDTVTVGLEAGYRFFIWKGLHVTPVLRYWPNVYTASARDGVAVRTSDGGSIQHKPAQQGFGGFFPNVLVGWAFDT